MTLLHTLSYAGAVAAFMFVVLSLASGLLWIAEIIEEHSTTSKVIGTRAVYVIILLHVSLYLFDSLPLLQILFSICCHVVYLQNFSRTWPFISLSSVAFVASCVLCIVDHFIWFFYFSRQSHEARQRALRRRGSGPINDDHVTGFAEIATFFATCVWFVPLFLFLSLSASDNALPMSSEGRTSRPSSPTSFSIAPPVTTTRSSLFKSLFDQFPRFRSKRRDPEGIIAPRSSSSAPSTPSIFAFTHTSLTSPSRNLPLGAYGDEGHAHFEMQSRLTLAPSMKLGTPPRRVTTSPHENLRPNRTSTQDADDSVNRSGTSSGSGVGLGHRKRSRADMPRHIGDEQVAVGPVQRQ